jgi:hypothetical protein
MQATRWGRYVAGCPRGGRKRKGLFATLSQRLDARSVIETWSQPDSFGVRVAAFGARSGNSRSVSPWLLSVLSSGPGRQAITELWQLCDGGRWTSTSCRIAVELALTLTEDVPATAACPCPRAPHAACVGCRALRRRGERLSCPRLGTATCSAAPQQDRSALLARPDLRSTPPRSSPPTGSPPRTSRSPAAARRTTPSGSTGRAPQPESSR